MKRNATEVHFLLPWKAQNDVRLPILLFEEGTK